MNNISIRVLLLFIAITLASCGQQAEKTPSSQAENAAADTVYTNGKIYTVDEAQPWVEAVAIKDGKFIAVGSGNDVAEKIGDATSVVDLQGKLAIPGLIDPHNHAFEDYHSRNLAFSVKDTSTPENILEEVKAYDENNPGEGWITGGIFPSGMFPGNSPGRQLLDAVVPDRPVCLADQSAHAWWCNTKALEITGIMDASAELPEGAIIDRDKDGVPKGTVREHSIGFLRRSIPPIPHEEWLNTGRGFMQLFNSLGLTTIQIAAGNEAHLKAAGELQSNGELSVRLVFALNFGYYDSPETKEEESAFVDRASEYRSEFIDPGYIKIFMDGAPDGMTGWLLEPYVGTDNYGVGYFEPGELVTLYKNFTGRGVGIMSHATGNRSVREVLNAIEATQQAFPNSSVRHHVTHNGMIHPDDIGRFKKMGIAIDVAPTMPITPPLRAMMEPLIGKAGVDNYADARAAIDSGAYVAIGSDWQVSFLDPWKRIAFHVSRMDPDNLDQGLLNAEKALTVGEAIKAYTLGPAYAMNKDSETGSIEVGKYADMIVLDHNIFEVKPLQIADTKVLTTVFAGRVVHEAK